MSSAQTTMDHDVIRTWTAGHVGPPSGARAVEPVGILGADFGHKEESLEGTSCKDSFRNGQD